MKIVRAVVVGAIARVVAHDAAHETLGVRRGGALLSPRRRRRVFPLIRPLASRSGRSAGRPSGARTSRVVAPLPPVASSRASSAVRAPHVRVRLRVVHPGREARRASGEVRILEVRRAVAHDGHRRSRASSRAARARRATGRPGMARRPPRPKRAGRVVPRTRPAEDALARALVRRLAHVVLPVQARLVARKALAAASPASPLGVRRARPARARLDPARVPAGGVVPAEDHHAGRGPVAGHRARIALSPHCSVRRCNSARSNEPSCRSVGPPGAEHDEKRTTASRARHA